MPTTSRHLRFQSMEDNEFQGAITRFCDLLQHTARLAQAADKHRVGNIFQRFASRVEMLASVIDRVKASSNCYGSEDRMAAVELINQTRPSLSDVKDLLEPTVAGVESVGLLRRVKQISGGFDDKFKSSLWDLDATVRSWEIFAQRIDQHPVQPFSGGAGFGFSLRYFSRSQTDRRQERSGISSIVSAEITNNSPQTLSLGDFRGLAYGFGLTQCSNPGPRARQDPGHSDLSASLGPQDAESRYWLQVCETTSDPGER